MNSSLVVSNPTATKWDIFCCIVDNYGDIGVCWRLAKQLVYEHHLTVRLFIDLPEVAQKIIPNLNTSLSHQKVSGVEVRVLDIALFSKDGFVEDVAEVVIEAFACGLPKQYTAVIQLSRQPTIWLNLEYLSAEKWVDDFHLIPSVNPTTGLIKHYFFPGFNRVTGGLLREEDLIARRDTFQANHTLQLEFFQQLSGAIINPNDVKVSLFCYPHAPLLNMLKVLSSGIDAIKIFIPDSIILSTISQFLDVDKASLNAGNEYKKGCLSIYVVPFLSQDDYDKLLWCCDVNFIRGEDSWVRAIWAGKPFIWQPYFQQEESHINKLNAFLDDYCQDLLPTASTVLRRLNHAWVNATSSVDSLAYCWNDYIQQFQPYKVHAQKYTKQLAAQADLASRLVDFCNK